MKVVQYNPSCHSNFRIVLLSSKERNVIPRVLLNTCRSFIDDNAEAGYGEDEGEEVSDDEGQTVMEENIKNEDGIADGLPSGSGVARSVTEPEVESEPSPVIEDNETGTVRGWNRLLFRKENPEEHDKKGLQIEIHVNEDLLMFFCDSRFRRLAVGSILEASDYGWDAVALSIIVNAIYGQYQYVPFHIDLELFVKIAVIADRMKCAESLHMAGRVWCANLDDHKAVSKLNRTTLMWLYVSWVFTLEKVPKSTERLFAMGYQGPETVQLNGLPLQGFVDLTRSFILSFCGKKTRVLPDVSLRQHQYDWREYLPDLDRLDVPSVSSPLPHFRIHEPVEIRLRVSSAHMTIASPVIKRMLQGPWSESAETGSPDSFNASTSPSTSVGEISTIGWNADALIAVLNVIHGRHSDVPQEVHLRLFADFAAPKGLGRKSILWLYISWVFSWHETFADMAMLIWKNGEGLDPVKTYNLPIAEILENLDNKRQEATKTVLGELDNMIGEIQEDQVDDTVWGDWGPPTDHACRCMTLGSALREKRRLDTLDPPLTVPYTGYPFSKIISMVHEFRSMDGHVEDHDEYVSDDGYGWGSVPEQERSPKKRLKKRIDTILSDIERLNLANFRG
ncbi:hypothetical protein FACUT_8774 [Fusarium acutatum]|uniref:Uncharacterized protein n=1 Tax=Fusarium acutatum TaxID=78861 RepID=A0A8H4JIN9_9HYPO|nr:hypothetical protein FACUT_8774 [Fusarium acutatum]